jgi:pyrimidine deaminase RibD-like protein
MIAAIKAMLESRSERRKKADPLVGAVLVRPDGKSIEAHRGHFGSGDHGEFSLLEKSGERMPAGSTLYVTLEPCSKRGDGKTPCADRVVAAGIQHVVIGIHDPNPDIYGRGKEKLKRGGVEVDFFDDDLAQQIRNYNSRLFEGTGREGRSPEIDAAQESFARREYS